MVICTQIKVWPLLHRHKYNNLHAFKVLSSSTPKKCGFLHTNKIPVICSPKKLLDKSVALFNTRSLFHAQTLATIGSAKCNVGSSDCKDTPCNTTPAQYSSTAIRCDYAIQPVLHAAIFHFLHQSIYRTNKECERAAAKKQVPCNAG